MSRQDVNRFLSVLLSLGGCGFEPAQSLAFPAGAAVLRVNFSDTRVSDFASAVILRRAPCHGMSADLPLAISNRP